MPALKIARFSKKVELEEMLKKVDEGQLMLSEVQTWCSNNGLNVSLGTLSHHKNSMALATTERVAHLSEVIEQKAQAKIDMRSKLYDIILNLAQVLENSDVAKMEIKNPKDASNMAIAIGTLMKTHADLERETNTSEKTVIMRLVEQKAQPLVESLEEVADQKDSKNSTAL